MPAVDEPTDHFRAHQFAPLPPDAEARWANFLAWPGKTYFPTVVGLVKEEVRTDYSRIRLPYRVEFEQPAGIIHGGAIATLVDTVVVPAIGSAYPEFRPLFTIDMQLRYLSPVDKSDAIAEGWVRKRGRSIVFCDVDVWDTHGTLCATATMTYKVGKPAPAPY
jgi:uncharacterized protein (TIGR00369 family)